MLDLSEALADIGEGQQRMLALAERDIEAHFAATAQPMDLELVVRDVGIRPERALAAFEEMTAEGIGTFVVGPPTSAQAVALMPKLEEHGAVMINSTATSTKLSVAGDSLFRVVPDDHLQSEAVATAMARQGIQEAIILHRDDVYGKSLAEMTADALKAAGLHHAGTVVYAPDAAVFANALTAVEDIAEQRSAETGLRQIAVHVIAYGEVVDIFTAAADRPLLGKMRWFGSDSTAGLHSLAGEEASTAAAFAAQVAFLAPSEGLIPLPEARRVTMEYQRAHGEYPSGKALAAYDALWMTALALRHAQSTDPQALARVLPMAAAKQVGVAGAAEFNANGDRINPLYDFYQVSSGPGGNHWRRVAQYGARGYTAIFE